MHTIEQQAWQCLPEHAQQEVYDFFLFVKQRYEKQSQQNDDNTQTLAFSNHSASNIEEWASDKEDEIWT
jgi:hypothetical protein